MTDTLLTPDEAERFAALYGSAPKLVEPEGPGVFAGAYKGLAGIPSGLAGAPLSIASAATAMPGFDGTVLGPDYLTDLGLSEGQAAELEKASKDYFSTTWQYAVHQPIEQLRQSAADYYRPDPQTTGFVGNTLFGAADVLTRVGLGNLVAPGSGLAVAAGTTGYERTQDLEAQGVDAQTAQASGALTGASLLASGGISSLGRTVTAKAVSGALLNAGFGAGTRALDSSILAAGGYTAQAEQQRWNDGAALAADLIIGGAFHLLPSRGKEAPAKPPAETVDAALAAKAAQGVTDSAPGVPADPMSASAHVTALDTAQAQLMDGQPVEVDPIVRDATFAPRPEESPGVDPMREALAEAGVDPAALDATPEPAAETVRAAEPAPYEARLRELNDRRRAGETLTPAEQVELIDLQDQDAQQAKVAGQPILGVRNMAARAEAERLGELLPTQVFADADNFKDLNDTLGHGTGDDVIRVIGRLMADEFGEGNVFHRGGDEFIAQGKSEADVAAAMERVRSRLAEFDLVADTENGPVRQKGVGLSYGKGADIKAAEADQYADKDRRKAAGLRHDRRQAGEPARESADNRRNGEGLDRRGLGTDQHPVGETGPGRVTPRDAVQAPPPGTDAARAGAEPAQQGAARTDAEGQPRTGLDPARVGEVDRARAAAAAHPDAVLADGTTAAEALRSADHEVQEAQTQGEAIAAAVACFLRFGSEAA